MKIVQINSVCGQGSTGRIAVDIAIEVERRGHVCYIAYGHGNTVINAVIRLGTDSNIFCIIFYSPAF